ncbi:MAG: rod shape-determining protein RodA [Hyphomicrobium sp.]|nr:MAG: rod shape-determining protein RodA [Hyphomicrobium sp.]
MGNMFWSRRPDTLTQKFLRVHWGVLLVATLIAVLGTATLYSVAGGSVTPWAEHHALRFLFGLGLVLTMAAVPLRIWIGLAYPVFASALVLLCLVPIVGVETLGARRWLSLGPVGFQPSELMKVALVVALARYYQWLPSERVSRPFWVLLPLLMIAVPVALTLRQPDLGSATLFACVGVGLMGLAGVHWGYAIAAAASIGIGAPLVWNGLYGYQRRRIEVFLDPEKDPLGAGYHITQSKIALGSGGVSGRGYIQGTQSQLDFIPEKHTDFIFTIFAEEWGFAGAAILILLFILLIGMVLRMAHGCRSVFGRLLIGGLALTLFAYAFVNMAMVTGLVPVVGVPLPLFSYGGTAMTTIMVALGLAMSAHVHGQEQVGRPQF